MRTVLMWDRISEMGVVEIIPLVFGGAMMHLYRSQTAINVVQEASKHTFYELC